MLVGQSFPQRLLQNPHLVPAGVPRLVVVVEARACSATATASTAAAEDSVAVAHVFRPRRVDHCCVGCIRADAGGSEVHKSDICVGLCGHPCQFFIAGMRDDTLQELYLCRVRRVHIKRSRVNVE